MSARPTGTEPDASGEGGGRAEYEAAVVARCRLGDDAAWRELVEHFSRYVYAIIVQGFRLADHDADDVFQEVFSRVYTRLDQLRSDDAVRPWLAQLTRNCCLDRIRSSSRVEPTDDIDEGEVDETLDRLEDAWAIRALLDGLSDNCREILDRFFARDESYRVIGEALELPAGTVASRISRCLATLRERAEGREGGFRAS
jgi:RNA polymerase sigma factor (sigma-70 family)